MQRNMYIYILVMAAVSYTIRVLPLTLIRKPIRNRFIRSFLYYVPYVNLSGNGTGNAESPGRCIGPGTWHCPGLVWTGAVRRGGVLLYFRVYPGVFFVMAIITVA